MEEQLAALLQSVQEGRAANDAKLEAIQQSLELWRPVVLNLQGQLDELRTQVGRIAIHPALADPAPPTVVQQVPPPPSAVESGHHGPSGHGGIDNSGGLVHGVVTTLAPPPVKGAFPHSPSLDLVSGSRDFRHGSDTDPQHSTPYMPHAHWALPKLDFPQFDGDNPQFWKTRCEKYFDVYGVQREMWVRVATLHFIGNAARWLQLHEANDTAFSWEELCVAVSEKFGRDQYQAQLRQFANLSQTGTVTDYMNRFEELMHNLLAHNSGFDPVYFTTKFLDGLHSEIRAGVVLHRPTDLDSAFSLSLLQEELLETMRRRDYRRPEPPPARAQQRPLLAPAAPLPRVLPPAPREAAEDRRGLDAARAADRHQEPGRGDDRVAALRNYRRARGLCFKCGERWGQGHQCAATVQLHIVEELLELLQAEVDDQEQAVAVEEEEQLMSISKLATTGQTTPGQFVCLDPLMDMRC